MDIVYEAVVVVHFLGLASLIGGFLVQMSAEQRGINNAMLHGALTQLVTGLILVGMSEGGLVDEDLNMTKISIKLVIAAVVLLIVLLGRRKPADAQQPYWVTAGALAIVNVVVAVFL